MRRRNEAHSSRQMKRMLIALSPAVLAWGLGSHPASAQEARGPEVWVASSIHGWIHIIHLETNQLDRVLRDDLPGARWELCWVGAGGYSDLAVGEGRLWAVAPGEGVCGIDPSFHAPPSLGGAKPVRTRSPLVKAPYGRSTERGRPGWTRPRACRV